MRIGLVELLLILLIASLTIGPSAALWVDRWMRRAQKTSAAAARRRAAQEAQRAAEREEVLQRFQKLSIVFVFCAAVALIWGLVLRPIEAAPTPYTAPDVRQETGAQTAAEGGVLELAPYTEISALRENNGWLYAAAKSGKNGCLLRMQPDGTGRTEVLTTAGEITDFAFAPDGTIWMTTLESEGGRLYRVNSDQWGVTVELTVSQIDGRALSCPTAVAAASDGVVYFTDLAAARARHGVESALRTELTAHTGTGSVYVYDPAARTVETVLTGIAGASGLALDEAAETLYVSDLGSRCVWAVDPAARDRTAGGKGCSTHLYGLPGYPGALSLDADGTFYISYRWARSGWLEDHAGRTLLRGMALRLSQTMQEGLFSLSASDIRAEAVAPASGSWQRTIPGGSSGSTTALCPVGSRVYLAISGETKLHWVRV